MALSMCILPLILLGSVALLGAGGYLLYGSFNDTEPDWIGSPLTARLIGIVILLGGLALLCLPVLLFGVGFTTFTLGGTP